MDDIQTKGYRTYGTYLREKYNSKSVIKVTVDGGFTCPNRDGTKGFGGCTYCNTDSYTPEAPRNQPSIREQLMFSMERAKKLYEAELFVVYFQPNSNTYAPISDLKRIYDEALSVCPDEVVGFSVGTRPDCLDEEKIALLESYSDRFDVDVEIGMESIYDDTLRRINRGYLHSEFVECMKMLDNKKIDVCVHTILGFPWETKEMMLKYIDVINSFANIKFVKFHHLHIVEGSAMAVKYKREPFPLFTLEEYAQLLCEILPRLRPDIIVQRLFGVSDLRLLIAPIWQSKKGEVQHYIEQEILRSGVIQGSCFG